MRDPTPLHASSNAALNSGKRYSFQSGFIDFLKIIAAQLIVLHHLAFYGPMSDYVRPLAPGFIGWLESYARIAVQVFLVTSGFLAAKSLSPRGTPGIVAPIGTIWRRYIRLVPPFLVATGLAVGASALAGLWMTHSSISAMPTLPQLAAHALLLHTVLGYESISAGAWYVAIDFQLYALLTLLLWLSGKLAAQRNVPWLVPAVIISGVCVSLLYFNRDARWDAWAFYFFGSYGLGIIAWWARDPARQPSVVSILISAILLPAMGALILDFRSRIAVALVIACALILISRFGSRFFQVSARQRQSRFSWSMFHGWGNISYGIFLVHFSVCLVVNAIFTRFVATTPLLQALGMLIAWMASVLAGAAFYRWVQCPLARLSWGLLQRSPVEPNAEQFLQRALSTLK